MLSLLTGIPDREDSADFYVLLLGATLGMLLMASANHLLMVFIAVEMAACRATPWPASSRAGGRAARRRSSTSSTAAAPSGVMLYGISLLAGKFGTGYLPDVADGYVACSAAGGERRRRCRRWCSARCSC